MSEKIERDALVRKFKRALIEWRTAEEVVRNRRSYCERLLHTLVATDPELAHELRQELFDSPTVRLLKTA